MSRYRLRPPARGAHAFSCVGLCLAVLAGACGNRARRSDASERTGAPAASVPLTAASVNAHGDHAGMSDREAGAMPVGYAPITIDAARAGTLGIETFEVGERDLTRSLRTVGVVALDETRTSHVHAKIRGWIDTIHVAFVGRKVSAGEPLCSIYSQEVLAAQVEFLSVLERVRKPTTSGEFAQAEQRAQQQLLDAARRRLSLWDVPKSEIDRLETTRETKRTFPLLAPRSGVVVEKQALDGMYVDPSVELYTVSDLSRVWVLADIYEGDVPFVHVGDRAALAVEGTTAAIDGKIAFLNPTVDEATRTLKARFELPNRDGALRPGAFVNVTMDLRTRRILAVPEASVLRTGTRSIVFVSHNSTNNNNNNNNSINGASEAGARHLEPREIRIGSPVSGFYPVEAGLGAGEHVVTGAQFLLDSESRLRATSSSSGGGGAAGGHGGH